MVQYNLIVAVCRCSGIGMQGKIPWSIKNDLYYFAKMTKGDGHNAVIMGKNTWNSLPQAKGLKDRANFVLSASAPALDMHSIINSKAFASIADLETHIEANDFYEEIWVIGGAQIYQQFLALNKIHKCYVTYIDKEFECDTFFPSLDLTQWSEIERTDTYDLSYDCNVSYCVYKSK